MRVTCGVACAALAAAVAVAPAVGAISAGTAATYHDRVDDAGGAPDIAEVTMTHVDRATLGVTVAFATPTDLGRYDWVVIGIDTDRNQRTGGMHGSEAIVIVNGERAVLCRPGGRFSAVRARLTRTELSFTLGFAQLGVRTFDFAVATLRQDADVAPDHGVFRYPERPIPAPA